MPTMTDGEEDLSSLRRLALYIGGFMGPFGTVLVVPMFPELREDLGRSASAVNLTFSLYLLTFAAALLVSGTLGERFGRRRTVQGAYLGYAAASALCAVAPTLEWLLAGRMIQGIANAFITPLLLAGLAEMVPPSQFGRAAGSYASFQALGGGVGPIAGGLAADSSWRLAFVVTAAVALLLASAPPDGEPRPSAEAPPIRPLLTVRMIALGVGFFLAAAGPIGSVVLVGVAARDEIGLSGSGAGLLLAGGAFSALVVAQVWGRLIDRIGLRVASLTSAAVAVVAIASLGALQTGLSLTLGFLVVGGLVATVGLVYQALGALVAPSNRGGALSFLLSFRFAGHAVGPIVLLPLFDQGYAVPFVAAGGLGLVTLAILAVAGRPQEA